MRKIKFHYRSIIMVLTSIISPILFCQCADGQPVVHVYCHEANDLYNVLQAGSSVKPIRYNSIDQLLSKAEDGASVMILADRYPKERIRLSQNNFDVIKRKGIRFYIEYADVLPGIETK